MSTVDHSRHREPADGSWLTWKAGLVLAAFLVMAGVLLFTEHRAHVLGVLVWAPLLACPLMHLFMHRGHGRHRPRNSGSSPS